MRRPRTVRHPRIIIGLLAAALAVRVAAAVALSGERFRFVDESLYAAAADRLVAGESIAQAALNLPGYPLFLALIQLFMPPGVLALRIAQAAVAALGVPLAYILGRRIGGDGAGIATAVIYAFDPLLVASAGLLYPETPAALLITAAVLAAWSAVRNDRIGLSALTGALLGLVTLFRPVSLAFFPAVLGWVTLGSDGAWRRRAVHAAVVMGLWGVMVVPWMATSLRATGHLVPGGVVARARVGSEAVQQGVGRALVSTAVESPVEFAGRTLREFVGFWELSPSRIATDDPDRRSRLAQRFPQLSDRPVVGAGLRNALSAVSFGAELLLAAVGLVAAWRFRWRETVWLVSMVLSFALGYALFFGKVRYRIPILPIVFAFAGLGAALAWERLRDGRSPRMAGGSPR
jgi:4-amino-4-deoxy-L-arabinose transferase-like glycosyltransferase